MLNESKVAKIITSRASELENNQQDVFDRVEFYHKLYRSAMDYDESYPWDYTLTDPVIFYLIRNYMSRLNPDGMNVRLSARKSSVTGLVDVNQSFVNWELSEMNKVLVLYRFLFRGLLAGRAYIKTGWKYEPAVTVKTDNTGSERDIIMRDVVNRAYATNVRFQDILIPNQNIPDLYEQPYVIEKMSMRYGDMLKDNELQGKEVWNKKYLDLIKKHNIFDNKIKYGIDLPKENDVSNAKDDAKFLNSRYVNVLKMQTLDGEVFYTLETKEKDWILNKDTENPFWHGHYDYVTWTPFPEDDDYFSMGVVQPVSDLAVALTSTLNQYLTNARKAGSPMWIKGQGASQTPDWQFVNRPDGVISVTGDINQIKQITTADTSQTMVNMRNELNNIFEKTAGMPSLYTSGIGNAQINKTARGAQILDSNIDVNIQMLISLFGAEGLGNIGTHFLELNTQYITEEQEYKLTGKKGSEQFGKIGPAETTANFDVYANPNTMLKTNPVTKQAQLLNFKATMDEEKDVKFDKTAVWGQIIESFPELDEIGSKLILNSEDIANEAIASLKKGIVPVVTPNEDHELIIKIVQKHILDMPDMDRRILQSFIDYITEQKKYIEASNPNLIVKPPEATTVLPTDEQALLESLSGDVNPTAELPNRIPMEQMGGGI